MIKMISYRCLLATIILFPISNAYSADTTVVSHATYAQGWETFIMGDTTATGEYNAHVYMLESSKVYYQLVPLRVHSSMELTGASYDESAGGFPATIQQIPGADGSNQFDNWPASNVLTYGTAKSYKLSNLLFNGAMADGSGTTFGVMATYGEDNTIVVDKVTSVHNTIITYFNFGKNEAWTVTNCKAVQYSCYAAGMYFGGFWWGAGSWMGTLRSLYVANNTIEGAHANPFVIFTQAGLGEAGASPAIITHNTIVNSIDQLKFPRDANNTHWTNNLIINGTSQGQTRNAANTALAQNTPDGHGKMLVKSQQPCADSTLVANGQCYDYMNRNIHFENNAWFDTPALIDNLFSWGNDGWCWPLQAADGTDSTDANGAVVELCDTMLTVEAQSKWMDDSTAHQIADHGVSETNNIHATDLGFNLDEIYINTQILRSKDWLDNGVHDTYNDTWWMHQADNDPIQVEWPLPMDFSYSTSSVAYTHATGGYPVGDLNSFPDRYADWLASGLGTDNEVSQITPSVFTLAQNYPNPFNPSTSINFTLDRNADINLSIYNMLGQKVRTLAEGSKNAGSHTLQWNGLDDAGQSVSTGIYLYKLTSGSKSITKKMAFMK